MFLGTEWMLATFRADKNKNRDAKWRPYVYWDLFAPGRAAPLATGRAYTRHGAAMQASKELHRYDK